MTLGPTTPILRIFDEAKALELYVDYLGFVVDWRHRFAADFPLHLQVSRDACVLHLSEHSLVDPFGNRPKLFEPRPAT